MNTFPNVSKTMARFRISNEIDRLVGDNAMVWALRVDAPLDQKIDMLLNQYNDSVNTESARNGLYMTVGKGLYNAVKDYNDKYNV